MVLKANCTEFTTEYSSLQNPKDSWACCNSPIDQLIKSYAKLDVELDLLPRLQQKIVIVLALL